MRFHPYALFLIAASTAIAEPKGLGFGPISYFEDHCANCHGSMGSNYGDKFGEGLSDARLSQVVKEMCDGPGNAPLDGEELKAEIAFHRALAKKQPFVSLTSVEAGKLTGEAPVGSNVVLASGDKETTAAADQEKWTISLAPGTDLTSAALRVTKQGDSTTLRLQEGSYTHARP
jgi:hypothetical protein